jgi:hypothetical protein
MARPCWHSPDRFSSKPKGNRTETADTDGRYMFGRDPPPRQQCPSLGVRLARTARYNPSERFNAKDIGR